MNAVKKALNLDPLTPLYVVAPNKDRGLEIIKESGTYELKLPDKEVTIAHAGCISFIISEGSYYSTFCWSGGCGSEDVPWR
jgi:hypothetical protein